MSAGTAEDLASEVADAHAASTLAAVDRVDVSFSSGGLAFAAKRQPAALTRAHACLSTARQAGEISGARPRPWTVAFSGSDELKADVDRLREGVRRRRWEPEDVGAFAAAALWSYLMAPLLLTRATRLERLGDVGGRRRLRVTLPPTLAGHGNTQTLHIGSTGLIEVHDYTATAFGNWARAAQAVRSYQTFDGVPIATRRRVTPRLGRHGLALPELVWIEVHDVRLGRTTDRA